MNYSEEFKTLNEKINQKDTILAFIPHGMKCDNPNCDWQDMSINFEDYAEYVNKPCPVCGENLFTEKCAKNVIRQVKRTLWLGNLISKFLTPEQKQEVETSGREVIRTFEVDKDGKILL